MKLESRPHHQNSYPKQGVLIKSSSARYWIEEISRMGLQPKEVKVFPIPDRQPNSVWGCLLVTATPDSLRESIHPMCQLVERKLYIPAHSRLYPNLTREELQQLAGKHQSVFHPAFGLVSLEKELNWQEVLSFSPPADRQVTRPIEGKPVPSGNVRAFKVYTPKPEDVLKKMEAESYPERKSLKSEPLSTTEKLKLSLLKTLFKKQDNPGKTVGKSIKKDKGLASLLSRLFLKNKTLDKLQSAFENLQERNEKELDKLLSMFRQDPEKALQYAIPLDEGEGRGQTDNAAYQFGSRWDDLSLGWSGSSGGGGISINSDKFLTLRQQYENTAKELLRKKDYKKAAFIYLKLLKDHFSAASSLEQGKYWAEAASVHLKYRKDKKQAAECYEKGMMLEQAIELQKEFENYEKVGDLYQQLYDRENANRFYGKVVEKQKEHKQFIRASMILKDKMKLPQESQALLYEGWTEGIEALNCLDKYLSDYPETAKLGSRIRAIYQDDVNEGNRDLFLHAILKEFKRNRKTSAITRDLAYEILVSQGRKNPSLLAELKVLNREDQVLYKDILRYRSNQK